MQKYAIILFSFFAVFRAYGQEVFRLDFEEILLPEGWSAGEYAEWGRVLGDGGTSFFRFHPVSWMDELLSPELELEAGNYTLYYSWNEAASSTPDYCEVRLRSGNGPWQEFDRIGEGNGRTWQRDSASFGMLEAGIYRLAFAYRSTVRYPSRYLNLDNIYLIRREIVTGLEDGERPSLTIYPSPADEKVTIRMAGSAPDGEMAWKVFTAAGRQVAVEWTRRADDQWSAATGHLPPGIYTVGLATGREYAIARFVIQR